MKCLSTKIKFSFSNNLFICLMLAAILVAFSCKKEANNAPKTKTKAELLATGSWKISTWEFKQQDGTWVSKPPTAYMATWKYTFHSNNTYTFTAAANTGGTYTGTGGWHLADTDTVLILTSDISPGSSASKTLGTLSETSLQFLTIGTVQYPEPDYTFTTYEGERIGFSH